MRQNAGFLLGAGRVAAGSDPRPYMDYVIDENGVVFSTAPNVVGWNASKGSGDLVAVGGSSTLGSVGPVPAPSNHLLFGIGGLTMLGFAVSGGNWNESWALLGIKSRPVGLTLATEFCAWAKQKYEIESPPP